MLLQLLQLRSSQIWGGGSTMAAMYGPAAADAQQAEPMSAPAGVASSLSAADLSLICVVTAVSRSIAKEEVTVVLCAGVGCVHWCCCV
jgi:hypothetical protein